MPSLLFDVREKLTSESNEFSKKYCFISELGRGRFAVVHKVKEHNGNPEEQGGFFAAAKIMRRRRFGLDTSELVTRELAVLDLARGHPSIVQLLDCYQTHQETILLLEHCAGGDLYRLSREHGALSQYHSRCIVIQILEALLFMHRQSLVHLDVKPQNVLIRNSFLKKEVDDVELPQVCLCDFGLSRRLVEGTQTCDLAGTPDYAAPEVLDYNPIEFASDMWSVGVLTYFILTAQSPFFGLTKEDVFMRVSQVQLDYGPLFDACNVPSLSALNEEDAAVCSKVEEEKAAIGLKGGQSHGKGRSSESVHFVRALLKKKPQERMTASEALCHSWLMQSDSTKTSIAANENIGSEAISDV